MNICNCCNETFEEPVCTHQAVMNPDSPGFGPAEYGCPKCGHDDYDEAVVCQACGEWSQAEYCTHCHEDLKKCDGCDDYFPVSLIDRSSDLCADCLREEQTAVRIAELKIELRSLGVHVR